jgi:opacity protein-like surface antigen
MKVTILCILICLASLNSFAQDSTSQSTGSKKFEDEYKRYRDSADKYALVPAVSMALIQKGEIEINLFNSLLTATKYWNDDHERIDLNARATYLYNALQVSYGVSKNSRLNIGLDINMVTGRIDTDPNSSMFQLFNSSTSGNSRQGGAIASIAPRIRWRPLKNNYKFTIQSSVSIPTVKSDNQKKVLGQNQFYFLTQFLYNQPLSKRLFLFSQLDLQYGFKNGKMPQVLYTPLSFYLSYLVPKRTVLFTLVRYVPIIRESTSWKYSGYTFQAGGGVQYSFNKAFLINAFYAGTLYGRNYGNYQNYNVGLRYLFH